MTFIKFTINGKEYNVSNTISPDTSLNSYLRNHANLRGTKSMCHEGGCGACIVSVAAMHPVTNKPEVFAVNSCLVSVLSCHGWAITTVEDIGNKLKGYHPIQNRLAAFNGTQCGYCTPGWVMNMYSLLESSKDGVTMKEVENSFAGNICRCTGYRPILDAFKSFSKDCDPKVAKYVQDIEELSDVKLCEKSGLICTKSCEDYSPEKDACNINMERPISCFSDKKETIKIDFPECKWFKVYDVNAVFQIFAEYKNDPYMLVAGNTAQGVYHMKTLPKLMIDISNISDLKKYELNGDLKLGGNMTLADTMTLMQQLSKSNESFYYMSQMYQHMDLIAHIPVRNVGTLAGNLSIKHEHKEFQSDVFVLFETVGATLTIADKTGRVTKPLKEYLDMNMNGRIIESINLPPLSKDYSFYSYKIMPRAQNSHAHVNAGFLFKLNKDKSVVEKAAIVYGGINPEFTHAVNAEKYVLGKNIFNKSVLKETLNILNGEIVPQEAPPEPSPEYRRRLAVNLFYKFILHISPPSVFGLQELSGGHEFARPVSSAKQDFDTNKDNWPLNKPISKIEALVQCSGEAKFANDLLSLPGELYAAMVLSTVHGGVIDKVDASDAMKKPGVVAFFTAKDIPGKNSFTPFDKRVEEILSSSKIYYHGQPVALVVAETEKLANDAAEMIKITYKQVPNTPPVITVRQALQSADSKERLEAIPTSIEPKEKGMNVAKVIKGSFDFYGQYHYTMEAQTCVCVPTEDGLDVYPASQWMDLVQQVISESLNIPENRININVRRLGGGYGGKITRTSQVAAVCALAAVKLNRPVRLVMSMKSNMAAIGKRQPYATDYEVGVDENGTIQYLNNKFYGDDGCNHNDACGPYAMMSVPNCYDNKTWKVEGWNVLTDTASNTACRAPGSTEGVAMIENIMEHIAVALNKDPLDVRMVNMSTEDNPIPEIIETLKASADFNERKKSISEFNAKNSWRKRGISVVPLKYNFHYFGNYASMVSIYHGDGSVSVTHGGIEMGQGINTKVAQVCAHVLGIPLEKVSIKPSNSFVTPNAMVSGGSVTSETVCFSTKKACEILLKRLEPIKKDMEDPTWEALIEKAHTASVDLNAHHMFTPKDGLIGYPIWAAAIGEVEVDILTGNHQVLRVDILEDTGESLSPQIDIGQVEGAFIMGLGYWTSESLVYDDKTGELLTNRTWNYKPPGIKDIPIDFRVSFRRNAPNSLGVLRSKATGEPPLNMSIVILFAIKQAITAAKLDNGFSKTEWFEISAPYTPEKVLLSTDVDIVKK